MPDVALDGRETGPIQHFIFARELAEVYLLLDHLSGRSDKGLADLNSDGMITKICNIGWPPKGTDVEQAEQAAILLMARDRLNTQAKPANGASIAFTLLVAGDRTAGGGHSFWNFTHPHSTKTEGTAKASADGGVTGAVGGATSLARVWGGGPPSRTSLARLAFPGLEHLAFRFQWFSWALLIGLFIWLLVTCFLSWDVSAGQALVRTLDSLKTERTALATRLTDYEVAEEKRAADANPAARNPPNPQGPSPVALNPSQQKPPTTADAVAGVAAQLREPTVNFCDRPFLLERIKLSTGAMSDHFHDANERALCTDWVAISTQTTVIRRNLVSWLDCPWKRTAACFSPTFAFVARLFLPTAATSQNDSSGNDEAWAVVLLGVLGTSVLPFCYGLLGAGAAVVRNLWAKMRDSLLSPRDLTLSLGQLALGAVIGACIGLFVTSSGSGSDGSGGLFGNVPLTAAALSFIAGFGVEGVFVALEALMKRVFNIPNPTS